MDFKKTIQLIDSATADFEKSVSGSERLIYAETQKIIKSLEIDASGKIKPSVKNLRLLTKMRKYVARLANNKGYLKAVKDLVNSFEDVYQSQMKYFATITQDVPHTQKYALMKQIAVDNVTTNLTGAGVQAIVTDKINDILLRAVTSGAKYADLTKELHEHLTKTDKGSGALSKYANTYATTAISQYAGENNKILTDDLGLEWFEYVGSNIETTREFCEHLTEKRYIHKSEIKTILKGEIDGHQCEIYEKTGLPKGMIEGTTEQNFQVNCGGWNCRHQLVPVAKEAVPKDIRAKFEKPTKAQKPTKTEEEKKKIKERWTQRRLKNMESELPNNLTKEEKKAIAENCIEIEQNYGATKGSAMTYEQANTGKENPHYKQGGGYHINCQTCTVTHWLRRLGFKLQAKPNEKLYKRHQGTAYDILDKAGIKWTERFVNIDGSKVDYDFTYKWKIKKGYKSMTTQRLHEYLNEKLSKDGVYEIYCGWKGGEAHVFCAEVSDRKVRYFDPQSGDNDVSRYIPMMKPEKVGVIRIDNKKINPDIGKLFLNAE